VQELSGIPTNECTELGRVARKQVFTSSTSKGKKEEGMFLTLSLSLLDSAPPAQRAPAATAALTETARTVNPTEEG
jgi:hypothetical protein